ncbi:hypothetical protein AMJ86_02845 [bacterium SM23_57]|nr:MAG: hypothetical protein AMJ86_02845 [bacterium SM23_57]
MKAMYPIIVIGVTLLLNVGVFAQDAVISFRTGDPIGSWCPILDENSDPLADGYYIGLYVTGADDEVDLPSSETATWGEPTDDDIRATNNTIGSGMDHLVMGYNEPPFVPDGNLFTGNGLVALPMAGTGIEPVWNQGERGYLRAFNATDYGTATHYNDMYTVNGTEQNWFEVPSAGPMTVIVCFTEAIPIEQGLSPCEPIEASGF